MNQSTVNMLRSLNNSFHLKYLAMCKAKNCLPNHEVCKYKFKLEIIADRIKMNEWLIIIKSLDQDNYLQGISIHSRNAVQCVREQIDSEKRCRTLVAKGDPLLSTKFVFFPLIRSISNCIKQSTAITSLALEGLPLTMIYIQSIASAILQNSTLKMLSFARSNIMDNGCIIICSTIKHLSHIEKINFSQCDLTDISATHISDLIKFQTINRYLEGYKKSFRYTDVGAQMLGLKCLVLNGNTHIGDKGLQQIMLTLKDDEWIKALEIQNCGVTEVGARAILNCLNFNKALAVLDVGNNSRLGMKTFNEIQKKMGAEPVDYESGAKKKLRDRIDLLEQRLEVETTNGEKAHELNIKLHNQLKKCESIQSEKEIVIPSGFKLVKEEFWNVLFEQLQDLKQEKVNRESEQPRSVAELRSRFSESLGFGDAYQLLRNNHRMSTFIQEDYNDDHIDYQNECNSAIQQVPTPAEDQEYISPTFKNKMKSVHTICKENNRSAKEQHRDNGHSSTDKNAEAK